MSNGVIKQAGNEVVLNGDTGEMVSISPEQRAKATMLNGRVLLGVYYSAMALKQLCDEKLYLALGYGTQTEYLSTGLPFGMRQAFKYLKIAEKFENVFNLLPDSNLPAGLLSNGLESELEFTNKADTDVQGDMAAKFQQLGVQKLYQLTQFDDDDLLTLVRDGKVSTENGTISFEELQDLTAKQLALEVKKVSGKFQDKIKHLNSRIAVLEEENKLLSSEAKTQADKIAYAEDIEQKYGAIASKTEDKRKHLTEASNHLYDCRELILRCGISTDDVISLQNDLVVFVNIIRDLHTTIAEMYGEVILNVEG